jgi:hypothetical protein
MIGDSSSRTADGARSIAIPNRGIPFTLSPRSKILCSFPSVTSSTRCAILGIAYQNFRQTPRETRDLGSNEVPLLYAHYAW